MIEEQQKPQEQPKIKLNIACGQQKIDGWVGIDKVKTDATDVVHDLEAYPWPLPDDYADEVQIIHFIEHVKDLPAFMDELCRIMKQGAKALVVCPYYSSMRSMQDPFHIRPISEASFLYYNKEWRKVNKLDHYGIKCDFDFSYGYILDPNWANRSQEARDFAIKYYINVVNDIQVTLTKK
jgi:ubiquinone/menaquinone biosynthesis C-methylase UbiE